MLYLLHSAKGSTWDEHKYIKRLNGTYYYPDSYKGGRHLPEDSTSADEKKTTSENSSSETDALDIDELREEDISTLAAEVIRGNFGNGDIRKELLGKHYQQVQDRVNQILRGNAGSQTIASADPSTKAAGERALKAVYDKLEKIDQRDSGGTKKSEGIDLTKIYSVYDKQAKRK